MTGSQKNSQRNASAMHSCHVQFCFVNAAALNDGGFWESAVSPNVLPGRTDMYFFSLVVALPGTIPGPAGGRGGVPRPCR